MNKKIKLIELLNKIATGEDLPKRIKIQDYVFELSKDYEHYYYNEDVEITHLINHNFSNLNDEIEILEDNTEEQEKLGESWKEVEKRVEEWAKEFKQGFKESFTEIVNYPFKNLEDNTEEIEELDNWFVDERKECREFDIQAINLCFSKHRDKINELVKAVNGIRKDLKNG